MAKSKSGGKVARAAKAGGGRRARQTAERSLLFPAAMVVVVVLGVAAVFFARDERDVTPNLDDHWHSAFGIYVCDAFEADLPNDSVNDESGIHTHGDGLIHIHPFAVSDKTGPRANLGAFFDESELELTDESVQTPTRTIVEGETKCTDADGNEVDGELRLLRWNSASAEQPVRFDDDLRDVRFTDDGEVFVLAFVPPDVADEDIPKPTSLATLEQYSPSEPGPLGVDEEGNAITTTSTTAAGASTTTAPGGATTTTAAGGATTTTAAGAATTTTAPATTTTAG